MKTTKLTHHIILSGITVSLLFSPLMALPSGGKFTHGTTGTININGNTMNINGHKVSSVIQWGGGFSINQGESVNFGGSNKNYLNIAHGTSKSTIAGLLNANGNNVFLINPNGVIITKTGTINANRFVASTSSMDSAAMQNFANMNNFNDGLSFSPVFKPNKLGNVVNMGNINANNITLQGNKVVLGSENYNNINKVMAKNIKLEGNEVYVDVASIDGNTLQGLNVDAKTKGNAYLNANGYYYNPYSFSVFSKISGNNNFKKDAYVGIGSDVDWWHFAKGWNENKTGFRTSASEYRLTKDIDFGGNNNKNYANYWIDLNGDGQKQDNEYTNMIVGNQYDLQYGNPVDIGAFNKIFDGQGYTLKNINIKGSNDDMYLGIFGVISNGTLKNFNVDYENGSVIGNSDKGSVFAGGIVGIMLGGSSASHITLSNVNEIKAISTVDGGYARAGGFAGGIIDTLEWSRNCGNDASNPYCYISASTLDNIYLKNINKIYSQASSVAHSGGFTGEIWTGNYNYNKIGNSFDNIVLNNIINIEAFAHKRFAYSGGFVGHAYNDLQLKQEGETGDNIRRDSYSNIVLNNIKLIKAYNNGEFNNEESWFGENDLSYAAGFAGRMTTSDLSNIVLNNIGKINAIATNKSEFSYAAGFVSVSRDSRYFNIIMNNMGSIIAEGSTTYHPDQLTGAAGFVVNTNRNSFNNIYMFFNKDATIKSSVADYYKLIGNFTISSNKPQHKNQYKNVFMWAPNNILATSEATKVVQMPSDVDFNLQSYAASQEQNFYTQFKNKIQEKFQDYGLHQNGDSFTFTTDFTITQIPVYLPDINSIKNEQAQLDNDDLISNDIWDEYIIKDIDKVNYKINMRLLAKLLKEYPGIASKTENEQVKFMTSYLGVNETDARALLQSLSFLNAYKDNTTTGVNFKDNSVKTKFETSFNNAGNKVNVFNTNKNLWHNKLITLYNDTVKDGLLIEEQLLANQNKLDQAIKAYDNFVMLIKKGLKNENDPAFIIIKDNITKLNKEAKELYANLSVYKKDLKDFKTANNTTKVSVVGNFKDMLLVVPDVNKPISGGGDGEDPNKPDLPKTDLDFEQTASLNLIGDNTLEEESEKQEVEETALMQKGKICIVSDNFKTMNPCIVRSF
ncbi:two-partner secretion domain-containing protein [Campylobacter sp. RM16704]|uniref:two-partner secretion domain-containing protein n=1 Tax=Campylobacter sp. RM16704 TaxID=1500960 RepID=UPI000582316A|nr:filamentous hemagglutinin N-terminal domain-containing protein [Campylobacter sp. RM16704]AJC86608.1 hemagglutinin domain-containing protein [Campylobacter sp. RM16704]